MNDHWLGWDWDAIAAIATFLAVVVALIVPIQAARDSRREWRYRSGSNVVVKGHIDSSTGRLNVTIQNFSTAPITEITWWDYFEDPYFEEPLEPVDKLALLTLLPGCEEEVSLTISFATKEIGAGIEFTDGNKKRWIWFVGEKKPTRTLTKWQVWRRTKRNSRVLTWAPWRAFRGFLNRIHIENLDGLYILVILALTAYIIWR